MCSRNHALHLCQKRQWWQGSFLFLEIFIYCRSKCDETSIFEVFGFFWNGVNRMRQAVITAGIAMYIPTNGIAWWKIIGLQIYPRWDWGGNESLCHFYHFLQHSARYFYWSNNWKCLNHVDDWEVICLFSSDYMYICVKGMYFSHKPRPVFLRGDDRHLSFTGNSYYIDHCSHNSFVMHVPSLGRNEPH